MLASQLMDLRATLHKQGIIFAYSGYVTEPVLSGVGEALKQKLTIDDADTKTLRSVFAVFVEQMQNIIRYSAEKSPDGAVEGNRNAHCRKSATASSPSAKRATTMWSAPATSSIATTWTVSTREAQPIRDMSKDELKALYKEQLRAEPEAGSKGAGLGFMEIARRASKPIEFDFPDVRRDSRVLRAQGDHLRAPDRCETSSTLKPRPARRR